MHILNYIELFKFIYFHFLEAFLLKFLDLKFHLHSHYYHLDQHPLEPENIKIIFI